MPNFWSFCGMGPYVIAVPYSDSTPTGPYVWAQQGQNNSFVQPTNAPGGRIGAIVGQFLMVGDILQAQTQVIGTGDGVKASFTFGLNDIPMLATGSVYDQSGLLAGTFQNGQIVGSGLLAAPVLPGTLSSIGDTYDGSYVNSQFSIAISNDPGQSVFTSITANGVTLLSSAAVYSYTGGIATWVWTNGPFGFGTGVTYPVTFTGANFLTSFVSGSSSTAVNGYSPYTLTQLADSFNGAIYAGSQLILSASSDPGQFSAFTSMSVNGKTFTSASTSGTVNGYSPYTLTQLTDSFNGAVYAGTQMALSAASDPGQAAFTSMNVNGKIFNSASASYSYSSGTAFWTWNTGPVGFTSGNTYPVTFTGATFFSTIVSGQIIFGGFPPTKEIGFVLGSIGTNSSSAGSYSYSAGTAVWTWNTGPFGFTSGISYPVTFTGANFFSTIVAGQITFGGFPPIRQVGFAPGIGTNTSIAVFTGYQLSSATGSLSLAGSSNVNYLSGDIVLSLNAPPPIGDQIFAQYTQSVPYRLQWSAIGDPTNWPIPLTANAVAFQSSFEDLEVDLGPVKFIAGYPLYGVIFQEFGITRANYVGGNVVFSFSVYSRNRGLMARGAACVVGQLVYFLAQDGFQVTDGSSVNPIGTDQQNNLGIDTWFFANVNKDALETIRAAYDSTTRNVYFAIPTGTNTLPDTLLAYNPIAQKWTKSAIPVELLWTDTNASTAAGSILRLALFTQAHQASLLNGPTINGFLETLDLMDVDGDSRFTMGIRPNIACTDTPQAKAGVRNSLSDPVTYSVPAAPDPFSRIAPALVEGIYTRVNVSSSAASAFTGATVYQEEGGGV